jgi:membrane-bound hydrogenase subunit mbhJ
MNAGGCNGCDIEIVDALTPRHDLEQYGIVLKGTPRQADVLVITGGVTLQIAERVKRIYEQMPAPKFVVAVGNCSTSGGVFQECPWVLGGLDYIIPVDAYVYGCPPRPENIVAAIATLLDKLKDDLIGIEKKEIEVEQE